MFKLFVKKLMFTLMNLFIICAEQNYHSRCFKKAHIISLKKSNKSNYMNFKIYRLIAFFNTLNNTLTSIIVKRISNLMKRTTCFLKHKWVLVERMLIKLTSIHNNSRWYELYCEFSKVQLTSFFSSYCDYFVSSHQTHAKTDTYFIYSFTREKRYIEEK
jgi:hypothetical protein